MTDERALRAAFAGLGESDRDGSTRARAGARFATLLEAHHTDVPDEVDDVTRTPGPRTPGPRTPVPSMPVALTPAPTTPAPRAASTVVFCDPDPGVAQVLRDGAGGLGVMITSTAGLRDHLMTAPDEAAVDTVVLGPGVGESEALAIADFMRVSRPSLGVILVRTGLSAVLLQEALRAGVREVVDQRDHVGLEAAVRRSGRLSATLREAHRRDEVLPDEPEDGGGSQGQVMVVFSAKGGCGKTMLATNLASTLADRGRRRVVILDLDLAFGDVAITLQLHPGHTIADAVSLTGQIDATAVAAMLTTHASGVSAIVAPTEPTAADSISASLVAQVLDVLRADFDHVVVDTPAAFDDRVLTALEAADLITLVTTPDVPALKNLKIAVETLTELGLPRERFRLVLNRADAQTGVTPAEVEKAAQLPVVARVPSSRDVPASINRGETLVQADPRHAVSRAIRLFVDQQVDVSAGRGAQPPAAGRGWRGLLRRS